jgi:hypothetical protein
MRKYQLHQESLIEEHSMESLSDGKWLAGHLCGRRLDIDAK